MRPKSLILLSLALGCGLVASLGINQVMSKGSPVAAPVDNSQKIFVAVKEINMNDLVAKDAVRHEPWPKDKIPAGAVTKPEDMQNRRVRQRVFPGQPILEPMLLPKGQASERSSDNIPAGYRVVAINVDAATTGGNLLQPGDRVDLLLHLMQNSSKGIPETMTKTLLRDVKVFAVNSTTKGEGSEGAITARTVSLLLKPNEAEMVGIADQLGKITLSLRAATDQSKDTTSGVTLKDVIYGRNQGPISTPAPPALPVALGAPAGPPPGPPAADQSGKLGFLQDLIAKKLGTMSLAGALGKGSEETWKMELIKGTGVEKYEIQKGNMQPRLLTDESPLAEANSLSQGKHAGGGSEPGAGKDGPDAGAPDK